MDMSYLRGACGVTRCESESNEKAYERCANRAKCGAVEWMKRNM